MMISDHILPGLISNRSVTGGLSAGISAGVDEHIYYVRRDGQVHLVLGAEWAFLGGGIDIPLTPC